jgi:hypothetical protein
VSSRVGGQEAELIGAGVGHREAKSRVVPGAEQQLGEAPGSGRFWVSSSSSGRHGGQGRCRVPGTARGGTGVGGDDGDSRREGDVGVGKQSQGGDDQREGDGSTPVTMTAAHRKILAA